MKDTATTPFGANNTVVGQNLRVTAETIGLFVLALFDRQVERNRSISFQGKPKTIARWMDPQRNSTGKVLFDAMSLVATFPFCSGICLLGKPEENRTFETRTMHEHSQKSVCHNITQILTIYRGSDKTPSELVWSGTKI